MWLRAAGTLPPVGQVRPQIEPRAARVRTDPASPRPNALGLAVSLAYAGAIGWVYLHQPQTIAEVRGGLASSVGVYRPDPIAFADGLRFFHQDQFVEARLAFDRADAAHRDPTTQFYVAVGPQSTERAADS